MEKLLENQRSDTSSLIDKKNRKHKVKISFSFKNK